MFATKNVKAHCDVAGSVNKKQSISVSRFPANCLFWQTRVFTFLHLISPVHVVHPLRNKETNKLGGQHKMYQRATVLDVARQPLWRYVKGRHRNCDNTYSFATNVKKYNFSFIHSETSCADTATVAAFDVPPQGLSRNITMRLQVFGSERHV
jgi:hypothetical protein